MFPRTKLPKASGGQRGLHNSVWREAVSLPDAPPLAGCWVLWVSMEEGPTLPLLSPVPVLACWWDSGVQSSVLRAHLGALGEGPRMFQGSQAPSR